MVEQIGLNWDILIKFIVVALFFIVTYVFIVKSNKDKITKIENFISPKNRNEKLITFVDCQEMQINCHKIRVLELENIFTRINSIRDEVSELKRDFGGLRKLIMEAIQHNESNKKVL